MPQPANLTPDNQWSVRIEGIHGLRWPKPWAACKTTCLSRVTTCRGNRSWDSVSFCWLTLSAFLALLLNFGSRDSSILLMNLLLYRMEWVGRPRLKGSDAESFQTKSYCFKERYCMLFCMSGRLLVSHQRYAEHGRPRTSFQSVWQHFTRELMISFFNSGGDISQRRHTRGPTSFMASPHLPLISFWKQNYMFLLANLPTGNATFRLPK